MKNLFFLPLLFLFYLCPSKVWPIDPIFLSHPCPSPDGASIVFAYGGDLWQVPLKGGKASRLTSLNGHESYPKYSPDGNWIAFTNTLYGNQDVYVMKSTGGHPVRLTFHSAADQVASWSWDSKYVYFSSDREGNISGFKVSLEGGTPKRVFGNYFFQNDHNLIERPTGDGIFFNNSWESSLQVQRKGYKGSFRPVIQSYDPRTGTYKRYTENQGKSFGATVARDGTVYFIGDEENGEFNLYTLKDGKAKALTHFGTSIKHANVSANGDVVVFERDYEIHVYDTKSGKVHSPKIKLPPMEFMENTVHVNVRDGITSMDISPDGTRLAFTSRGELFVCSVEGKDVRKLDKGSDERAMEVKWLADNQTLIFSQTYDGYANWFLIDTAQPEKVRQITKDKANNRFLNFDHDRRRAVYLSGRNELRLMDMGNLVSTTIAKDEIWAIWNEMAQPAFSPDGEFISYTVHRDMEEDIMIYHIPSGEQRNITQTVATETSVFWGMDEKYIYYSGAPLQPAFPTGMKESHVFRLPLKKYNAPFPTKDSLVDRSYTTNVRPGSLPQLVDTGMIMDREQQLGPNFGSQYLLGVTGDEGTSNIYFKSNQEAGIWSLWKLPLMNGNLGKAVKIEGHESWRFGATLVSTSGIDMVLIDGKIFRIWPNENRMEPLEIEMDFERTRTGELRQMFDEAWAKIEENYYDPTFHGKDWAQFRDRYGKYLEQIHNRNDFRILVHDLFGELDSSHMRINTWGPDETTDSTAVSMETGILFAKGHPYTVDRVIQNSPCDKWELDVRSGDVLYKVDGKTVDTTQNRNRYFTRPAFAETMTLTFLRGGNAYTIAIHPQRNLYHALFDEWIYGNRKRVASKGEGRIGYVFVKNTEQYSVDQFFKEMAREYPGKEALILDFRYNDGGLGHDQILRYLSQRSYAQWQYRNGERVNQGTITPADRPMVLLINEQTLSDGEMTAAGFKALGLGKVIGNDTYGWEIFTLRYGLVDGSNIRVPSYGCFTKEGRDIELYGVAPDIKVINSFNDNVQGKDPQLDMAIQEMLKKIGE